MDFSVEALWQMSQMKLLATYHEARRLYADRKFARDTERGRLQWLRAKAFVDGRGGVTERTNATDASEDLARKGQHVREMTHALELLKSDIDVIATTLRLRGMAPAPAAKPDETAAEEAPDPDELVADEQH